MQVTTAHLMQQDSTQSLARVAADRLEWLVDWSAAGLGGRRHLTLCRQSVTPRIYGGLHPYV